MKCCVCLLESYENINNFDNFGMEFMELSVADVINKHLWFKQIFQDMFTSQVCTKCWRKIYDFHQFYVTVENAHMELDGHTNDGKEENAFMEQDGKGEIYESLIQIERNVEIPSNTEKPALDCPNSQKYAEFEIEADRQDFEETCDENDNDFETGGNQKDCNEENDDERKLNTNTDSETAKNTDTLMKWRVPYGLDPIISKELVKKHIKLACELCSFVGNTFVDVIKHFKDHHKDVRPFIMCCDKKFTRSYNIAQHAYIHDNPNAFSCPACKKPFSSTKGLRVHIVSYHASEEERSHACEQCPRKFGTAAMLEHHKSTHIPKEEWNFICTKCTSRTAKFASEFLLKIHTTMYHKREKNICQVCAKEIQDKKTFEKHVRRHFENSGPYHKCPIENCTSWLKDEDNLKEHVKRYHEDKTPAKCPLCDKVCRNRRSLAAHKQYFHSNREFRCAHCERIFRSARHLKDHKACHTGEHLYKCPFCSKTFKSNGNMHAHKRKTHPMEWEESKREKLLLPPNERSNSK